MTIKITKVGFRHKKILAGLLLVAFCTANTQPMQVKDSWSDTRWSLVDSCDSDWIHLAPDGSVLRAGSSDAKWDANGNGVLISGGKDSPFVMEPDGPFQLISSTGSADLIWYKCDRNADRPFLPESYLQDSLWSGFGDCRITIRLARNGAVTVSNGRSGSWSVSSSEVTLNTDGLKVPMKLVRAGDELYHAESDSYIVPCNQR
jgi:hypothetical protein